MDSWVAETAEGPAVCRDGLPALMRQTRKDRGMKQRIIEYLQDAAAIVSIIIFLSALYVIMAAFG